MDSEKICELRDEELLWGRLCAPWKKSVSQEYRNVSGTFEVLSFATVLFALEIKNQWDWQWRKSFSVEGYKFCLVHSPKADEWCLDLCFVLDLCRGEAPGKFVTGGPDLKQWVTPIINARLRIFQKRKQKMHHEMKDVKKSDSNPGPHDQ